MAKRHRAYWKGYLRLSLVTIGVEVYNAVESKSEISFRQIHKPSGKRVNYEKVVKGVGKVETADIVKGYEVDTDTYVAMEPEEIDALKLESKKTIDLVQFVDASEVDYRFFERPYFVAPADSLAGEGYVVIRDALAKTGKVGLAQITIGGRGWLVALAPFGDGLVMGLRWLSSAGNLWTVNVGLRPSWKQPASRETRRIALSVSPSSSAPASEVISPPSNAPTTWRRSTVPKSNESWLHSVSIGACLPQA